MTTQLTPAEQLLLTKERLRILSWGYFVSGGMGAFFACFFLFYALMFGAISFLPESEWTCSETTEEQKQEPSSPTQPRENRSTAPPIIVFRILSFGMVGVTFLGWLLAGLTIYSGFCLRNYKHRMLINTLAAYNCLWIPYGTILGVLTFIVVNSETAIQLFEKTKKPPEGAFA